MKEYIATYGAISACLDVYQDFFSYGSGVYRHVSGGYAGGHCVALIGYDDVAGCWIAKNSWGPGWGDGGHVRIGYGECRIESYQCVGIQGVSLRMWLPDQQVLGLWSNEYDGNVWAYGSNRGWLKLDSGVVTTNMAMFSRARGCQGRRSRRRPVRGQRVRPADLRLVRGKTMPPARKKTEPALTPPAARSGAAGTATISDGPGLSEPLPITDEQLRAMVEGTGSAASAAPTLSPPGTEGATADAAQPAASRAPGAAA